MEQAADHSYDLIILDAFSSDSVPVHLITREAMALYFRKLAPRGLVIVNISNRYLDLDSVLGAIHRQQLPPGTAGIVASDHEADGSYGQSTSTVVMFTKSEEALAPYRTINGVGELDDGGLRAWTDDYSDILGSFMSRYRGR